MQTRATRSVSWRVPRRLAAGALAGALVVLLVSGEAHAVCVDEAVSDAVSDVASGNLTGILALLAAPLAGVVCPLVGSFLESRSAAAISRKRENKSNSWTNVPSAYRRPIGGDRRCLSEAIFCSFRLFTL